MKRVVAIEDYGFWIKGTEYVVCDEIARLMSKKGVISVKEDLGPKAKPKGI